jgi:hypothetical protein
MALSRLFVKTSGFPPFDAAPPKLFEFGEEWGSVEYRGFSDCVGKCNQSFRPYVAQFRPVCCDDAVYLDCELLVKKRDTFKMVETQTWMFVDTPSFKGLRLTINCPESLIIREIALDDWQRELVDLMEAETVNATDAVDVILTKMWEFDLADICGCVPIECEPGFTFNSELCQCIPDEFPVPEGLPSGYGWEPGETAEIPAGSVYYVYGRLVQSGSAYQFGDPSRCLPNRIVYDYDSGFSYAGPISVDYDILSDKRVFTRYDNDRRADGSFVYGTRIAIQYGFQSTLASSQVNITTSGVVCPLEFGTTSYTEQTSFRICGEGGFNDVLFEFDLGLPSVSNGGDNPAPPPETPCYYTQNVFTVTITKVVNGARLFSKIDIPAEPLCEEYPDPDSILGWLLPYLQSIDWQLGFISLKSTKGGPCDCP